jgi:3-deoxy-D-manno-octulosonic-acid transferase
MDDAPFGILLYRWATAALSPLVPLLLRRRILRGKEQRERTDERLGYAAAARPDGKLVWVHGASVGECVAALPLISALLERPELAVVVTSGTVTSAKLMAERLPPRALHQFVPIDTPEATARFLEHWRPLAGLFVDSDLWPNLVLGASARGVKLALINARMSARSYASWQWAPASARALLAAFELCLAQDEDIAARFRALGAADVRVVGSLKADAPALPADAQQLAALGAAIGARPLLLASQTHPGEEASVLPAHDLLRRDFPELLTIIVPRHPARGGDIAMLCGTRRFTQRSRGELPDAETAIYIADTMGELGLFYRLARFAFIGGSLIAHGGQNPLEPAKLGCAVLSGPHTFNFASAYEAIFRAQGLGLVHSAGEIAEAAAPFLSDPDFAKAKGEAARAGAEMLGGATAKTLAALKKLIDDAPA